VIARTRTLPYLLCWALAQPTLTYAEPTSTTPTSSAAQLFDEARALMEQGEYTPACPKLEESQRLDPALGTLLHLGHCYEKSGQLAAAYRTFQDAADLAVQKKQADKPEPREQIARDRAEALAQNLSLIQIRPAGPVKDLTITLDGAPIDRAQWNRFFPIAFGKHVLRASAPGYEASEQAFEIGVPARRGIEVTALVRTAQAANPESVEAAADLLSPAPEEALAAAPADRPQSSSVQRIAGFVALGAGAAGLALGTVLGVMRTAKLTELSGDCDLDRGVCPVDPNDTATMQRVESLYSQAGSYAAGANLAWIVGGVVAAGGLVLVLTAPRDDAPAVTLGISPGGLSLTARTNAL
jgi:hypothetical protein